MKKELRALFKFIKECYPIELSWARGPTKLWSLNVSSLFRPHALVTEQVLDVADVDAGSIHIRRTLRAKIAQTEVFHAPRLRCGAQTSHRCRQLCPIRIIITASRTSTDPSACPGLSRV